jgi:hypothetical protein
MRTEQEEVEEGMDAGKESPCLLLLFPPEEVVVPPSIPNLTTSRAY